MWHSQWLLHGWDDDDALMAYDWLPIWENGRNARPWETKKAYGSVYVWVCLLNEWECTMSETIRTLNRPNQVLKILINLVLRKSPHRNRRYQCACAGNDRSIRPNNNRNGKCSSFVWCSDLFAPTDRSLPTAGLNPFPPHLQPIFVW